MSQLSFKKMKNKSVTCNILKTLIVGTTNIYNQINVCFFFKELLYIYNQNSLDKMNVEVCKFCHQVLRANEMGSHLSIHNSVYN